MRQPDLARLYLDKGCDDELIATRLASMEDVPDSGVGFHVQQAIEKYLKAVLALSEVRVRKTHDISALLAQLTEIGVGLPEGIDAAMELTPYSVLERYPMTQEAEPLDRAGALALVERVREWAGELISNA